MCFLTFWEAHMLHPEAQLCFSLLDKHKCVSHDVLFSHGMLHERKKIKNRENLEKTNQNLKQKNNTRVEKNCAPRVSPLRDTWRKLGAPCDSPKLTDEGSPKGTHYIKMKMGRCFAPRTLVQSKNSRPMDLLGLLRMKIELDIAGLSGEASRSKFDCPRLY